MASAYVFLPPSSPLDIATTPVALPSTMIRSVSPLADDVNVPEIVLLPLNVQLICVADQENAADPGWELWLKRPVYCTRGSPAANTTELDELELEAEAEAEAGVASSRAKAEAAIMPSAEARGMS